jgi:hypothetical protein
VTRAVVMTTWCDVPGATLCDNDLVNGEGPQSNDARSRRERLLRFRLHLSLSRRVQFVSLFFLVGVVVLIPWTVFLSLSLPPKYDAGHWRLLWTGFDAALITVLLLAAWAAWYRRQVLAAIAMVAGTLLFCDAWFDMVTSFGHRDQWLTLLTGFGVEMPLGVFFFWVYRRIAMTTMSVLHHDSSEIPRRRKLRDFQIVQLEREVLGFESERNDPSTEH